MMANIFSSGDVKRFLSMKECITLMKEALMSVSSTHNTTIVQNPLRQALRVSFLEQKTGLLGNMPATCSNYKGRGYISNKVITVYPGNKQHGKHSHQGVVLLFDAEFGDLVSISDASEITAIRTAAVSAVAATTFVNDKEKLVITIMGTGEQAVQHAEAFSFAFGDRISKIQLWGRSEKSCNECVTKMEEHGIKVSIVLDEKEAVQSADIICTVTSSQVPIVQGEWLKSGQTVIAVGACTPRCRELDANAVAKSKLFFDCRESVINECGEYLLALEEGAITEQALLGEIGDVLLGNTSGRLNQDDIIIFKSLGIGIEDLLSAAHILHKAKNIQ
jgi:alanine dehydrogenase